MHHDNRYLRVAPMPDPDPNPNPVDDGLDTPLAPSAWWEQLDTRMPRIDDRLDPEVVCLFMKMAASMGYAIDVDYLVLAEDTNGAWVPTLRRGRGLAVLCRQSDDAVCADPHSSQVLRVPLDMCTFIRLDPFSGGDIQVPS